MSLSTFVSCADIDLLTIATYCRLMQVSKELHMFIRNDEPRWREYARQLTMKRFRPLSCPRSSILNSIASTRRCKECGVARVTQTSCLHVPLGFTIVCNNCANSHRGFRQMVRRSNVAQMVRNAGMRPVTTRRILSRLLLARRSSFRRHLYWMRDVKDAFDFECGIRFLSLTNLTHMKRRLELFQTNRFSTFEKRFGAYIFHFAWDNLLFTLSLKIGMGHTTSSQYMQARITGVLDRSRICYNTGKEPQLFDLQIN